jgi:hypothetical protein
MSDGAARFPIGQEAGVIDLERWREEREPGN